MSSALGPLFNEELGDQLKADGKEEALQPLGRQLQLADVQATARRIAREKGEITIDDLYEVYGDGLDSLGNGRGAIFDSPLFAPVMAWTHKMVKSRRPSRHSNKNGVWRLR